MLKFEVLIGDNNMSEKPLRNIYDLLNLKPYEEFMFGEFTIKYRFLPDGNRQWYNDSNNTWVVDNDEPQLIRIIQNPNLIKKINSNPFIYLLDEDLTVYDIIILKGLIEVYGPINYILKDYKNGEKQGCKIMFRKYDKCISFHRFWFDFFDKIENCEEFKVIGSEDSVWELCIKSVKKSGKNSKLI